jgi:large subunit ribosomal protein L9
MDVILRHDYPALGYIGDRVHVKRGFARNFLIPKGIAIEVGSSSAKALNHTVASINAQRSKKKGEAELLRQQLEPVVLSFTLRSTEHGKSFGSVSQKDVEAALKEKGFEFDRRQIRIPEPIKSAGKHAVNLKLHSEVTAQLSVEVTTEVAGSVKTADEAGEKKKRARAPRAKKSSDSKKTEDAQPEHKE